MTLLEILESNNITEERLDSVVHDAASRMAADANNAGVRSQVNYLKTQAGMTDGEILMCLGLD